MNRNSLSIAQSMVPSQMHTQQGMVNPQQFSVDDWEFNVLRAQQVDYQRGNAISSSDNYYALGEGYQTVKNGMFNPLTGQEPVYGHVNYNLNPLQQEQTCAHMFAYQAQKQTRVRDNMSPAGVMNQPSYKYGVNFPPNVWANVYNGSIRDKPPFPPRR